MSSSTQADDALLSASFSLYSNPGAYALLLGAGVSASSGILTAWPLFMDLVGQVATLEGEESEDPETWYLDKFGVAPTYEGVLEKLGPTQHERQRLLRGYFERSAEDVEAERKLPTPAHRAIARLVRAGAVRVIVTLNFDHLIEQAIRDEGLEPTIVASPADIMGMAPLHTLDCCVVHLHGDYLDPTSMRNTVEELGEYDPATQHLLERILQDYGLIVAGWSAVYDPVLRKAIAEHYSTRFTMTWIERSGAREEAAKLRTLKKGVAVTADADTAFGHLADGVAALTARQARHPLSVPVAVETAKRELAGRPVAIGLHDRLRQELDRLHDRPEFYAYDQKDPGPYEELVERVEEATLLPVALLATLAYWGRPETDRWWLSELPRFATGVDGSGTVRLLNLRVVSGSMLFYAAGITAVAAQRYDLLGQLFAARRPNRFNGKFETLAATLDASASSENLPDNTSRLHRKLAPLLEEALQIGREPLDDAWQAFELLRLSWAVSRHESFDRLKADFAGAEEIYQPLQRECRLIEQSGRTPDQEKQQGRYQAWQERDRALGQIGRLAPIGSPHVLASERDERSDWAPSRLIQKLIEDVRSGGDDGALISEGLFKSSGDASVAIMAVSLQISAIARELIWKQLPPGGGFLPSAIWLDSGLPPAAAC
ncbi:SIR2 family protein [Brachybacterium paraconglomeratum]|uniref:SIR2 family protein n=1 Tax=Brachybacterium paraconglomeratum TaxID=173362 RepID=UPI0022AECD18|nr:SIR2 family protein [Brachybacterium paraconglomeratum]MCZ4328122.1 SIR2 family protein [Brachybacterium paraconglomeratum]